MKPYLSIKKLFCSLLLCTCLISVVQAHHSFVVHFVEDRLVTLEGEVTSFRFTNPHGILEFTVTADDGSVQQWRAETNSPNSLRRRGWKKDSLKAGEKITISGFPSRDGDNYMRISLVIFEDGTELRGQALIREQE